MNKKQFGIFIAVVAVLVAIVFVLFGKVENDAECYKAGVEAHEANAKLRMYTGQYAECDETCPVCHPITWRWEIKKMRMGLFPNN